MHIPGHLSVGYLMAAGFARTRGRAPHTYTEILPVMLGALTPDIIDKSLLFADVSSHGRAIGHSLLTLIVLALFFFVIRRLKATLAAIYGFWILGIFTHLITDFIDDFTRGFLHDAQLVGSWFLWPIFEPSDWRFTPPVALFPDHSFHSILEISVVLLALAVAVWNGRR